MTARRCIRESPRVSGVTAAGKGEETATRGQGIARAVDNGGGGGGFEGRGFSVESFGRNIGKRRRVRVQGRVRRLTPIYMHINTIPCCSRGEEGVVRVAHNPARPLTPFRTWCIYTHLALGISACILYPPGRREGPRKIAGEGGEGEGSSVRLLSIRAR